MKDLTLKALEKNYMVARELFKLAKEVGKASLRLAPILYPTFRAPIPIEKRAEIYDKLFIGIGELIKVPEIVKFLVGKGDTAAAILLVEAWVKAIVEVLRAWDDLSGGIVDVAEVLSSAQRELGAGETTRIIGEMGGVEEKSATIDWDKETEAQGGDGSAGKTPSRRRKSGGRTKRNN